MVKLSELRKALQFSPLDPTSALTPQMREIQDSMRAATRAASAFQEFASTLSTAHMSNDTLPYVSKGPDIGSLGAVNDGLAEIARAKNRREKETHDHTLKQTALLEQSQQLQQRFIEILANQARLSEGMLAEAKSSSLCAKLAVYFAAIGAAVGLFALICK